MYKLPKKRGESDRGNWFPESEWKEIIRKGPNMVAKMGLYIGFQFGLRLGEICNLRVEDIDLENRKILIRSRKEVVGKNQDYWHPKHYRNRNIPLSEKQYAMLERWIDERPELEHPYLLWTEKTKQKVGPRSFQRWCKQANPILKPHDLRRSFAMWLYNNSEKNVKLVQVILGHSSVATTSNYLGLDEQEITAKYLAAVS